MNSAFKLKSELRLLPAKLIIMLGCLLMMLSSCKHDGIPADQFPPVPFSKVLVIYSSYCGKCHNGNGNELRNNFNDYNGIRGSVVPFNSSKSKSYQAMISTFQIMPPIGAGAMPKSDRTLIRLWIDQGANP
jgi:hypothetical protein